LSNRVNGARSGWVNRKAAEEYPYEVQFHVQWPNTSSQLKFRTQGFHEAHDISHALISALAHPNQVSVEIEGQMQRRVVSGQPDTVKRHLRDVPTKRRFMR
jgi:hypothetical protein